MIFYIWWFCFNWHLHNYCNMRPLNELWSIHLLLWEHWDQLCSNEVNSALVPDKAKKKKPKCQVDLESTHIYFHHKTDSYKSYEEGYGKPTTRHTSPFREKDQVTLNIGKQFFFYFYCNSIRSCTFGKIFSCSADQLGFCHFWTKKGSLTTADHFPPHNFWNKKKPWNLWKTICIIT